MPDTELDTIVMDIQHQYPMCGIAKCKDIYCHKDIAFSSPVYPESQRRIDPSGTALRRLHVLNRRRYSVPSPLSLYHINGHHKLIQFL